MVAVQILLDRDEVERLGRQVPPGAAPVLLALFGDDRRQRHDELPHVVARIAVAAAAHRRHDEAVGEPDGRRLVGLIRSHARRTHAVDGPCVLTEPLYVAEAVGAPRSNLVAHEFLN